MLTFWFSRHYAVCDSRIHEQNSTDCFEPLGGGIQSPVRFRIRQLAPYVSARTMSSLVVAECCEGGWWFVNLILAWERLRAVGVLVTDL